MMAAPKTERLVLMPQLLFIVILYDIMNMFFSFMYQTGYRKSSETNMYCCSFQASTKLKMRFCY